MMVERVGSINPIQPENRTGRNERLGGGDRADSIDVSQRARERAEIYHVTEMVRAAPELSEARIAELRERINDPAYLNERTIAATADRIMDAFGL